jgi:hypothetical protein
MKSLTWGVVLFACAGLLAWVCYDLLFSKPTTQVGVIKELLYIEGKNVATYTPYQGRKVGDHAIVVAQNHQHIAIVDGSDGKPYQVHCTPEHYEQLKVGDQLTYKRYEGEVFHIKYFAHYEDH